MKQVLSVFVCAVILAHLPAQAQRHERRETRQQSRIREGVQSGELTGREAARLHRGQRRVDRAQNAARADGEVSAAEKARLEKMQDVQSKRIYHEKHDNQTRGQ